MLALTFALALAIQGPTDRCSFESQHATALPGALQVEGTIELSMSDAAASARRTARDLQRQRLRRQALDLSNRLVPAWIPPFVAAAAIDSWVERVARGSELRVLDEDLQVRDFSYGKSYQTTLVVAVDDARVHAAEASLERSLRKVGKVFVAKCGAIAVGWGVLALLASWLDRLTRGYMTWRLRLGVGILGLALLPVVLLV